MRTTSTSRRVSPAKRRRPSLTPVTAKRNRLAHSIGDNSFGSSRDDLRASFGGVDKKLFVPAAGVGMNVGNRHFLASFAYVFWGKEFKGQENYSKFGAVTLSYFS